MSARVMCPQPCGNPTNAYLGASCYTRKLRSQSNRLKKHERGRSRAHVGKKRLLDRSRGFQIDVLVVLRHDSLADLRRGLTFLGLLIGVDGFLHADAAVRAVHRLETRPQAGVSVAFIAVA